MQVGARQIASAMEIKAIRMFDHGFMTQAFAFGGEDPKGTYDDQILYRSSLQNFLIDTGKEVILVDTGFKNGFPAPVLWKLLINST